MKPGTHDYLLLRDADDSPDEDEGCATCHKAAVTSVMLLGQRIPQCQDCADEYDRNAIDEDITVELPGETMAELVERGRA